MWFQTLLVSVLCIIYTVSGVLDKRCDKSCNCCMDRKCSLKNGYPNTCDIGCIDGHRGFRCYELCRYPNCKFCGFLDSDKTCRACYDGYYLGPKKDCTSQCPSNCKTCISSTNCTECKEGFYDKNGPTVEDKTCQHDCSVGCKDNYCSNGSGKCLCTINFTGDTCSECVNGKYGLNCSQDCPKYCKDTLCERFTGKCMNGCKGNFNGSFCDTCLIGKYGKTCNCELLCPVECDSGVCKSNTDTLVLQDGDGRKEQVTTAVLGSAFALSACVNIVQAAVIFVLCRQHVSKRGGMRQSVNKTSANQAVASDDHFSRTTQEDSNTATVTMTNGYEMISRSNDAEHDYQQL